MEIYGLCSQCASQRSPLMPLAIAKSGERLIIADTMEELMHEIDWPPWD